MTRIPKVTRWLLAALLTATLAGSGPAAWGAPAEQPGRVKWRAKISLDYLMHAMAVGPDGTVYVPNAFGRTQAIDPVDGSTKWIAPNAGGGVGSPYDVLPDGTVIAAGGAPGVVGGTDAIVALNPSGTVKWSFTATKDYLLAGPSVGSDGNIYAVTDSTGIGFFSLTPVGSLRFSTGRFSEYGSLGQAISFGPDRVYFGFDMVGIQLPTFFAYDMQGGLRFTAPGPDDPFASAAGPNGNAVFLAFPSSQGKSLFAYSPAGQKVYGFYEFPGSTQEAPDVGKDNVAYTVRNLSTLYAVNPNGTVKFRYTSDGIMFQPRVRPQNDLLFMGGRVDFGAPGFFRAVSTSGQGLWQVTLPTEPGFGEYGQLVPSGRPVFSPDGNTAYMVTDVAGDGDRPYGELYAYLYAIDLTGSPAPPPGTAPVAPAKLVARKVSPTQVNLTWRDRSSNETGFAIERRGPGSAGYVQIATVGANARSHSDLTITKPGTYTYRVRAANGTAYSAWSNTATVDTR